MTHGRTLPSQVVSADGAVIRIERVILPADIQKKLSTGVSSIVTRPEPAKTKKKK